MYQKGVGPSQPIQMIDIMVIISPYFGAISPFLLSKRPFAGNQWREISFMITTLGAKKKI